MASRLEQHEVWILAELGAGRSYAAIAADLAGQGCKTSAQNLAVWVKRRAARIQARQALIDPLGSSQLSPITAAAAASPALVIPNVVTAEPQAVAEPATMKTPSLSRHSSIKAPPPTETKKFLAGLVSQVERHERDEQHPGPYLQKKR